MNTPARSLHIALANAQVSITFETAVASETVLRGKSPEQAVKLVGLVHNLCGEAHRAAARAALGLAPAPGAASAVMLEILREHLVVLCRSAPPLLGLEPISSPVAFSRLGAAFAPGGASMRESFSRAFFGAPPGAAFSWDAVLSGARLGPFFWTLAQREAAIGLKARDISLASDPSFFARIAQDPDFVRPGDVGPLSERLLGRLFEVHKLCAAFGTAQEWAYAPRLIPPGGASIAAARGTLMHHAALEDGTIKDYAIATPTAAMLGERGPLACFLDGIAQAPQADLGWLKLALLSFDPCVPYSVEVLPGMGENRSREVSHA